MKIQLSTFLLLITITALSIAWYSERARSEKVAKTWESERERTIVGAVVLSSAKRTLAMAMYNDRSNHQASLKIKNRPPWIKLAAICAIIKVWENEKDILLATAKDRRALSMTVRQLTDWVECSTAIELSQLLQKLDENVYSELHNLDSTEFKSFDEFVSQCLNQTS